MRMSFWYRCTSCRPAHFLVMEEKVVSFVVLLQKSCLPSSQTYFVLCSLDYFSCCSCSCTLSCDKKRNGTFALFRHLLTSRKPYCSIGLWRERERDYLILFSSQDTWRFLSEKKVCKRHKEDDDKFFKFFPRKYRRPTKRTRDHFQVIVFKGQEEKPQDSRQEKKISFFSFHVDTHLVISLSQPKNTKGKKDRHQLKGKVILLLVLSTKYSLLFGVKRREGVYQWNRTLLFLSEGERSLILF